VKDHHVFTTCCTEPLHDRVLVRSFDPEGRMAVGLIGPDTAWDKPEATSSTPVPAVARRKAA
jgi:co-chaperonin GroES (HSP10)